MRSIGADTGEGSASSFLDAQGSQLFLYYFLSHILIYV